MDTTTNGALHAEGDKDARETLHRLDDLERSSDKKVVETCLSDATEPHTQREYLHGVKLWLMLASVTLITFVMLLDMSIIATASNQFHLSICCCSQD